MSMMAYYDLKDKLCRELDEIADKGEMSTVDLENAFKITGSIKNLNKIIDHEEMQGGRSGDGNWIAEGSYGNGRMGTHYTGGYYSRNDNGYSGGRYRDRYSADQGREMWDNSMRGRMSSNAYDPNERETMQRAYRNY